MSQLVDVNNIVTKELLWSKNLLSQSLCYMYFTAV